jgi:hypothetical protein
MKKNDVLIGQTYAVKVSGQIRPVKLTAESPYGGWIGRNMQSGREVRIKSAAKLRYPIKPGMNRGDVLLERQRQNRVATECNPYSDLPFAPEEDEVAGQLECPRCGECRVDWLVWQEDWEHIRCRRCQQVYQVPQIGQASIPPRIAGRWILGSVQMSQQKLADQGVPN